MLDHEMVGSPRAPVDTRAGFLRKAGLGGAAIVGGGTLLGAGRVGTARAGDVNDGVPDLDVLNFALTLEYLEASFYVQALGSGGATLPPGVAGGSARFGRGAISGSKQFAGLGGRVRSSGYSYLSQIRDHEVTHVAALRSALGGSAVEACTFDFSKALKSVSSFLATAQVLENTGVMAYDGAIRYVDSGAYLQTGAQIATVEARHAAYLNLINRTSPFPSAFDSGKKPTEIVAAVLATGFVKSCPQPVLDLFARFKAAGA